MTTDIGYVGFLAILLGGFALGVLCTYGWYTALRGFRWIDRLLVRLLKWLRR